MGSHQRRRRIRVETRSSIQRTMFLFDLRDKFTSNQFKAYELDSKAD